LFGKLREGGKLKAKIISSGKIVNVIQFCNDWFYIDHTPNIISPDKLQLSEETIQAVIQARDNEQTGVMFSLYTLDVVKGTFKRKPKIRR
jgi:hypothetical protein